MCCHIPIVYFIEEKRGGSLAVQIHSREGATHITSWGKSWLAVLGCYDWAGLNPTPPEFWLLPYSGWTGIGWIHPGRYWCHCRQVRATAGC